jgi:hypothetical protein
MPSAHFVLLLVAVVLFAVAAAWNPQPASPRYNLVAAGLTFLTLAFLFPG